MKKFLSSLILFLLPVLIISIVLEISLRNIPNDYSYKREYLDRNADQIEVIILGSSHAYRGINPQFIRLKSFNASYVSQSLDYDYAILKRYETRWKHLKYIVIPISYFTFHYKLETGNESWRVKNYVIYYDIDLSNRITDHSELLSNKLAVNFERIYLYYFLRRSNISCSELGFGARPTPASKIDLKQTAKLAAARQTARPGAYFNEIVFNQNVDVLQNIIRFASERNIQVILYTSPGYSSYVEYLDKSQLNQAITEVQELDRLYTNVIYVNYLNDRSFTKEDFWDGDHLNLAGAEKLTRKINLLFTQ